MMRTIASLGLLGAAITLATQQAAGGGKGGEPAKATKAPYVHAVYFYLKKDAPKDQAAKLVQDAHDLLGKIPSVRGLWAGRPAEMATPKVVVKDYDVGLLVLFDDYSGLNNYLDHRRHTVFVDRHSKFLERVVVYDFLNQKK